MELEALEQDVGCRNDGGAKRRQIMEGARSVFLGAGFDGASMNDVARAAGVSKGTLYAYFNSKEDLFEAIIRAEKAQAAERMCAFLPDYSDPRAMLTDFGVRLLTRMVEPEHACAVTRGHRRCGEISQYRPRLFRGWAALRQPASGRTVASPRAGGAHQGRPIPSAPPGTFSTSVSAPPIRGSCSASSTRSAARRSKPRSRLGSMFSSGRTALEHRPRLGRACGRVHFFFGSVARGWIISSGRTHLSNSSAVT